MRWFLRLVALGLLAAMAGCSGSGGSGTVHRGAVTAAAHGPFSVLDLTSALHGRPISAMAGSSSAVLVAGGHDVVRVTGRGDVTRVGRVAGEAIALAPGRPAGPVVLVGHGHRLFVEWLGSGQRRVLTTDWSGDHDGLCALVTASRRVWTSYRDASGRAYVVALTDRGGARHVVVRMVDQTVNICIAAVGPNTVAATSDAHVVRLFNAKTFTQTHTVDVGPTVADGLCGARRSLTVVGADHASTVMENVVPHIALGPRRLWVECVSDGRRGIWALVAATTGRHPITRVVRLSRSLHIVRTVKVPDPDPTVGNLGNMTTTKRFVWASWQGSSDLVRLRR
jgi:hypothetical protein